MLRDAAKGEGRSGLAIGHGHLHVADQTPGRGGNGACLHDSAPAANDPTGTTPLRRAFLEEARKRWAALDALTTDAIIKHNMLGTVSVASIGQAAASAVGGNQIDNFALWFGEAVRQVVMNGDGQWVAPYIRQAAGMAEERARGLLRLDENVVEGMPTPDGKPSSLYISRPVVNAADIVAWAKDAGFPTTLPADDMHVTVVFSRAQVDWANVPDHGSDHVTIEGSVGRSLDQFGDAVVLRFPCEYLARRHHEISALGASWDHPQYQPHVTITWNVGDFDWRNVPPYAGPIVLGPEIFKPVKEDWKASIVEDSSPAINTLIAVTIAELRGICDATIQQVTRAIGNAVLAHQRAPQLATAAAGVMRTVGLARTNAMINYMVVKAFAVITLEVFRTGGVEQVGTVAESIPAPRALDALFDAARVTPQVRHARTGQFVKFKKPPSRKRRAEIEKIEAGLAGLGEVDVVTADDDLVCQRCQDISDNGPYDINEALGLVPVHISCRCVFSPTRDEGGRFTKRIK